MLPSAASGERYPATKNLPDSINEEFILLVESFLVAFVEGLHEFGRNQVDLYPLNEVGNRDIEL